jgi:cytochrome P450
MQAPNRASTAGYNRLDPFPWYAQMRASAPVFREAHGAWHVFGYADVQHVLSDYATFSSEFAGGDGPIASSLISTDPPRHRQLRALATQAFTPRAVAALEPRITAIVAELLATIGTRPAFDMIAELAFPLPVIVIAELLGIPPAERDRFKRWSNAIIAFGGGSVMAEMGAFFREMFAARRAEPRDDLISRLLVAQVDERQLTERELMGFCVLLLVAGNETTTNLLGNAMLCFDEHPEAWAALRADPALLPNAIEEVLRYRSPVQAMFRIAKQPTELGGQRIAPGETVMAWIGSANRDDAQFADAARFDIRRADTRSIAFGHGIHYCLGAPLARIEARIALTAMLERYAQIGRQDAAPLEAVPSTIVYGVQKLPLVVG